MTSEQPHRTERLGDKPGFDAWADEVSVALQARRQLAAERATGEKPSADTQRGEGPKRRWRSFALPFSRLGSHR